MLRGGRGGGYGQGSGGLGRGGRGGGEFGPGPAGRCFVCGSVMNQLRDGRRRCPYHDQHFATVYHQTSLKGWLGIREDGYIHGSVSDGMIYASPTPEKTFSCARHKGIILEISVRRSYLDFTCTEPGKVRFSPKKDYNINKSVMVGDTPDSVPHSRQWTNEHIQVRHLVGCTCGCTPSSGGNGV